MKESEFKICAAYYLVNERLKDDGSTLYGYDNRIDIFLKSGILTESTCRAIINSMYHKDGLIVPIIDRPNKELMMCALDILEDDYDEDQGIEWYKVSHRVKFLREVILKMDFALLAILTENFKYFHN